MTEPLAAPAPAVPVDLTRLEALDESATPGPWRRTFSDAQKADHIRSRSGEWVAQFCATEPDAEFIAALRNAAPQLLAASRAVERVRAALVDQVEYCNAERVDVPSWVSTVWAALDGAGDLPPGVIGEAMMGPFDD